MKRAMEYIFTDEMLKLLDHFTSLTEVRIAFFSLDGEETMPEDRGDDRDRRFLD